MRRRWAAALLAAAAVASPGGAAAPGAEAEAFRLWFGGVPAGALEVAAVREAGRWRLAAEGRPARWLALLFDAGLSVEGEGAADPAPRPGRFAVEIAFGDDRQRVEMARGPDGAPRVEARPAFRPRPWQIDPAAQGDAEDPASLAARLLAPGAAEEVCGAAFEVFDGRRRSRVALGPAEVREGGLLRCRGAWRRVAGFRERDLAKGPVPILAEFLPGADGTARLVRLEVSTDWGVAVAAR